MKTTTSKKELTISEGQKLYRLHTGKYDHSRIEELTVSSIGKKYIYLIELGNNFPVNKFDLTYEHKNYSQNNFRLYADKQDVLDVVERDSLTTVLIRHFTFHGIKQDSLEQLRNIASILGINKNTNTGGLFKQILTKEKNPEKSGWYNTDKGNLEYFHLTNEWATINTGEVFPEYWYEELN